MTKGTKWLVAGLAVSLAVNFLIIGLVIGAVSNHRDGMHGPAAGHGGMRFSLERLAETMAPESREIMKETMREHRKGLRPIFRERRQARRETAEILRAETFDAEALRASFERMRNADAALQAKIQNALVDVAGKLPADERAKMAEWRRHFMRGGMRGGHRGHGGPRGSGFPEDSPTNIAPEEAP